MSREHALVEKYKKLKDEVSFIDDALSSKKKEFNACQLELMELLKTESKERTAVYEGLGSVSLTKPQVYASCKKEDYDILFTFLREIDRDDIIKETVNARTLSTFVKEQLEDGTIMPECISYYLKTGMKFNPVN